jgi:putative ABC transport system ATP-binding protein
VLRVLRARCDAGAAGVLVTHEPRYAAFADRTVYLRDGHIVGSTDGSAAAARPLPPAAGGDPDPDLESVVSGAEGTARGGQ